MQRIHYVPLRLACKSKQSKENVNFRVSRLLWSSGFLLSNKQPSKRKIYTCWKKYVESSFTDGRSTRIVSYVQRLNEKKVKQK